MMNRMTKHGGWIFLLAALILLPGIAAYAATKAPFAFFEAQQNMEGDSINIALAAEPSTSMVSDWETLDAVNDGYTPSNSNDKSHGAYGNWYSPNTVQWVQYTWEKSFLLKSAEIYWFDDNGGVLTPTVAWLQYYEDGAWTDSIPVPCVKNTFNYVSLGDRITNQLRVLMRNDTESTGILEFRVWGTTENGSTDIERPTTPGKPVVVASTDTSLTFTWEASTDNVGVEGYNVLLNDTIKLSTDQTTATVKGLVAGHVYHVSVRAFDMGGNLSVPGNAIWVSLDNENTLGQAFSWPVYSPTLDYFFKDEFPEIQEPTVDLDDCPEVVGSQSDGWWTFRWGPNKRSEITEAAITPMLERMNNDFAFFRDTLGWPPDKRAQRGYHSAIYLYGSGLCTDDADTTATGGWMGSIYYNGESWPMVLLSYYPVYCFDPDCPYSDREFQMGAVVHEGIHAVLADLPGCKNAAWFQEGGNTWLQQEAAARQSNDYSSMGFLNGAAMIAPFMPVECYSGWLQDDSFGGPSAEGVNMYNGNQQICTWRNFLGGNQYGNIWPSFLGEVLGPHSVAWIWRYCPGRVLEGMGDTLGDMQMRRLIMEYRAKQALVDMGKWSGAVKGLLNSSFGISIHAEWSPSWLTPETWKATPYVRTVLDTVSNTLTPEYRTTPGWSGANQIPLNVSGMGDTVIVNFIPDYPNMTCQLCYRTSDGTKFYSKPVSEGECRINLDQRPANEVVIAVITNTDYVYEGEETRKAHFTYKLQMVKGIFRKASVYKKWYDHTKTIADVIDPEWYVEPGTGTVLTGLEEGISIYPNPVSSEGFISLNMGEEMNGEKFIRICNMQGQVLYTTKTEEDYLELAAGEARLTAGFYLISISNSNKKISKRVVVK